MRKKLNLPRSYTLAVSRDGSRVASLGRNVVVADVLSGARLGSWHPLSHPSHAAFDSTGERLAVKSTSGEIVILRVDDGSELARHQAKDDEGAELLFGAEGACVIDASWSGDIRVWNADGLFVSQTISFKSDMVTAVSSDAVGTTWCFLHQPLAHRGASDAAAFVSIWQLPFDEIPSRVRLPFERVRKAAIAPTGDRIAVLAFDAKVGDVLALLALDGQLLEMVPHEPSSSTQLRWSPTGRLLVATTHGGFAVYVADGLRAHVRFDMGYPSDAAFIDQEATLVLGSWAATKAVALPALE